MVTRPLTPRQEEEQAHPRTGSVSTDTLNREQIFPSSLSKARPVSEGHPPLLKGASQRDRKGVGSIPTSGH